MNEPYTGPMVERHYSPPKATQNLAVVTTELPLNLIFHMRETIARLGEAQERTLGNVKDPTTYYTFTGVNVFLQHGLAQAGKAVTTDNQEGFPMIRLFANSPAEMGELEKMCGRYRDVA